MICHASFRHSAVGSCTELVARVGDAFGVGIRIEERGEEAEDDAGTILSASLLALRGSGVSGFWRGCISMLWSAQGIRSLRLCIPAELTVSGSSITSPANSAAEPSAVCAVVVVIWRSKLPSFDWLSASEPSFDWLSGGSSPPRGGSFKRAQLQAATTPGKPHTIKATRHDAALPTTAPRPKPSAPPTGMAK